MHNRYFLYYSLFFLLVFSPSILSAQNSSSQKKHSLEAGSKSLQFQIGQNFTLSSFEGSAFSYKWHKSSNKAYRLGLSINSQLHEYDWEESRDSRERNSSDFNTDLTVNFTWQNYTDPDNLIKFYYGFGPELRVGFLKGESEDQNTRSEDTSSIVGISGLGYAGVEWFFHPSMSLHAEYQASAGVELRYEEDRNRVIDQPDSEIKTTTKRTIVSAGGDGVRFGLSVYF